jgi:hypothetical protein
MSLNRNVLVECDHPAGCVAAVAAGTRSARDTRRAAVSEGWYVSQGAEGPDFCPRHLPGWAR